MKPLLPCLAALTLLSAPAFGQLSKPKVVPPLPATTPGSSAILLGLDSVRSQLGLTSLQKAVLNDIRADYREQSRAIVASVVAGKLSKKEGTARLAALTTTMNRRAEGALNASQRAKFVRIERQFLGAYALLDPEVQTELGLTDKQRSKIANVWWHYQKHISKVNLEYELGRISHNERIRELADIRYDASDDLRERLTNEQRAKLEELTGGKTLPHSS